MATFVNTRLHQLSRPRHFRHPTTVSLAAHGSFGGPETTEHHGPLSTPVGHGPFLGLMPLAAASLPGPRISSIIDILLGTVAQGLPVRQSDSYHVLDYEPGGL